MSIIIDGKYYTIEQVTVLPELPAATDVWVYNCPGLTVLPELPAATNVWVYNCPGLTPL